jgi:hypothetical protein
MSKGIGIADFILIQMDDRRWDVFRESYLVTEDNKDDLLYVKDVFDRYRNLMKNLCAQGPWPYNQDDDSRCFYSVRLDLPDAENRLLVMEQEYNSMNHDDLHEYVDNFNYVRDPSKILKMAELVEEAMSDPEELNTEDDLLVDLWYTID